MSTPFFSALAKIGERHFPSLLGSMCVVRPPEAAGWLVSNIKKVMSEKDAAVLEVIRGAPRCA